jgi:hypothetical protein
VKFVVAKVKCCGKVHEVRLSESGSFVAPSHRGIHATAAASAAAMGAPIRCLEVLADWATLKASASTPDGFETRLPDALQRVHRQGFDRAFERQQRSSPAARHEKKRAHAAQKIKELDTRIKRLQTAQKAWAGKLRRYAREVESDEQA